MTASDVCGMFSSKMKLARASDFNLYLVIKGQKKQMEPDERPMVIQNRLINEGVTFGDETNHFRVGICVGKSRSGSAELTPINDQMIKLYSEKPELLQEILETAKQFKPQKPAQPAQPAAQPAQLQTQPAAQPEAQASDWVGSARAPPSRFPSARMRLGTLSMTRAQAPSDRGQSAAVFVDSSPSPAQPAQAPQANSQAEFDLDSMLAFVDQNGDAFFK